MRRVPRAMSLSLRHHRRIRTYACWSLPKLPPRNTEHPVSERAVTRSQQPTNATPIIYPVSPLFDCYLWTQRKTNDGRYHDRKLRRH